MGNPIMDNCALIWWVNPVLGRISIKLNLSVLLFTKMVERDILPFSLL